MDQRKVQRLVGMGVLVLSIVFVSSMLRPGVSQAQSPQETEQGSAPTSTTELADSWDQAYRIGNWPEAIRIGKILSNSAPENPAFVYNLSCVYARKGDLELALTSLEKAVDLGFDNTMLLVSDEDLSVLRADSRFDALVTTSQKNRERAKAEFQSLADAQSPLIWTPEGLDAKTPAPVIIALHPFGSRAEWILDYWRATAEKHNAIVLAPRAVRPERNGFQWGTIEESQYILGRAFDQLKEVYTLDESRILLTGFSQGGYMAFNLGRLHGNVVTSVLPVAGQYERELADPALVPVDRRARFYILIGTDDSAYRSNILAMEDLRSAGFEVRIRPIRGLGHSFPKDHEKELETALDYLWK